jgi:hypothetical protein
MKRFFESLNFIKLAPESKFIDAAPGALTWCMSNGKDQWVVYYEPMSSASYPLKLNLPKGNFEAVWTDVSRGIKQPAVTVSNNQLMAPPGIGDKVAIIQPASSKKPPR